MDNAMKTDCGHTADPGPAKAGLAHVYYVSFAHKTGYGAMTFSKNPGPVDSWFDTEQMIAAAKRRFGAEDVTILNFVLLRTEPAAAVQDGVKEQS